MICSGFFDLQVNGFAGVDFNDPQMPAEGFHRAAQAILRTGVTRFLPTVITASEHDIVACLRNLRAAANELVAGFHVEGPHIGAEDGPRGAHPREWVRPPDLEEFRRWQDAAQGMIRLVTMSPHWPESTDYIQGLLRAGVTVSIGHTAATPEQIADAVAAGATLSTHLGNAAPAVLERRRNLYWAQLGEDRLSASFIADGWHLDDSFLRVAVRAKQAARCILVTDASAPADATPGVYRLGAQEVELTADERIVLRGTQKLAGSALRMNDAIANVIRIAGVSLADAVRMASENPARLIGMEPVGQVTVESAGEKLRVQSVLLSACHTEDAE